MINFTNIIIFNTHKTYTIGLTHTSNIQISQMEAICNRPQPRRLIWLHDWCNSWAVSCHATYSGFDSGTEKLFV